MELKRLWKDATYIALGLFLIGILMLRADVTDTLDKMAGIDLRLLGLVLLLYVLNTSCKVFRWFGLLKGIGAKNIGPIVLPIFLASLALNNSTPGKVGGEPVRAMMLKEHTGNRGSLGGATIFAEKSLDILTILALAMLGMVYMVTTLGVKDVMGLAIAVGVGGIVIISFIVLVLNRRFVRWSSRIGTTMTLKIVKGRRSSRVFRGSVKLTEFLKRLQISISDLRKRPITGAGVLLLTMAIWINEALRLYIILQALPGDHTLTFPGAVAAIAVANILGFILPIGSGNVIGSTSVLELLLKDGLIATTSSIVQVATSLWISLPLGIISLFYLRSRGRRRSKDGIGCK